MWNRWTLFATESETFYLQLISDRYRIHPNFKSESSPMSNKSFNDYKSPVRKLVKFFQESRDKWKARSLDKQKRIDFLETKVKDLKNSRDHWKQKAKEREKLLSNDTTTRCQELSNVHCENNSSTSSNLWTKDEIVDKYYGLDDIEILPHSNGSVSLILSGLLPWDRSHGHKYFLLIQELAIKMVLQAHTSLRGAMKRSNEVNVLSYLLNFWKEKFQLAGNHSKLAITLRFIRIATKIASPHG